MIPAQQFSHKLYDYYNDFQWHIKKITGTFNVATVWDFAMPEQPGVLVAVIDDGFDYHEDIDPERIQWGYDFANFDPDPRPNDTAFHGQACAGIIAASHTVDSLEGLQPSSGVISMNPSARIVSVGVKPDCMCIPPASKYADAINYAWSSAGADIISCSMGFPTNSVITDALEAATTYGRQGQGCPAIFAAGNEDKLVLSTRYPARLPFCFAVGAVDADDYRFTWSCFDSTLDLVAPSGEYKGYMGDVWSLDQMEWWKGGNNRDIANCPSPEENDVDYFCHFGGTSAACPMVAGIASLLLGRDPDLTVAQIYEILRRSASPVPHAPAIPSDEYGFGRADAFRALLSISRGDVNNDGNFDNFMEGPDIADLTSLIGFLFYGNPAPFPSELLGDSNCTGKVNVADCTYLVDYLFRGGPLPVKPCFVYSE